MLNIAPVALTILNQVGNLLNPRAIGYTKVYLEHNNLQHADATKKVFWNKLGVAEVRHDFSYTGDTAVVINNLTADTNYSVRGAYADEFLDDTLIELKDELGQDWINVGNTVSYKTQAPLSITNIVVSAEKVDIGAAPPILTVSLSGLADSVVLQSSPDNGSGAPTGVWSTEYAGPYNNEVRLGIPTAGYGTYYYRVGSSTITFPDGTIDSYNLPVPYSTPIQVIPVTPPPSAPSNMVHKAFKITDKDARYDLLTSWDWEQGSGGALRQFLVETLEVDTFPTDLATADWVNASKYTAGTNSIILANFPYAKRMLIRVNTSAWGSVQSDFIYDKIFITESANDISPVTPADLISVDGTIPANSEVKVDYYGITAKNNNKETFRLDARNGNINIGVTADYNGTGIPVAPIRFDGITGKAHIDGGVITNNITSSSFVMAWLTNPPGSGNQPAFRTANVPDYATPSPNGGMWMGYDGVGTTGFKMHMGSVTQYIQWDGSKLLISGQLIVKKADGSESELENTTGPQGAAGIRGNYTDYIYKVQPTNPGVPSNPLDPMPSGWFAVPPTYQAGEIVWVSEGTRNGIGEVITGWSMPTKWNGDPGGPAGNYYEYRYQRALDPTPPAANDPDPAGWLLKPETLGEALWFIVGLKAASGQFATGETWSEPSPHDGASMLVQYSSTTLEADFHNPPFVDGTDIYMRQKLTNQVDWSQPMRMIGEGAKNVRLSSDSQVFEYDKLGVIKPGQIITFTAVRQNIDEPNLDWTAWDQDGNRLNLIMDGTNDLLRTINGSNFDAEGIDSVRVLVKGDSIEDQITIIKVKEGADGENTVAGYLTNEADTLNADENGVVSSYASATGEFVVFNGLTKVTSGVTYSVNAVSAAGVTASIVNGIYNVTAIPSAAKAAWVDLRAVYAGVTITKRFSIAKALEGKNSKIFSISASSQTVKYNSAGIASPTNQIVVLNAKKSNITGTVSWTSIPAGINATGDTLSITAAQFSAFGTTSVVVTSSCAGLTDSTTITKLVDGDTTTTGYLTNESHVVPTAPDGSGGNYTDANGYFILYEGANLVPTSSITFARLNFTTGMTTSIDATGRYSASLATTADAGTATYRAVYTDTTGRTISIDKKFTLSKAKGGEDGLDAKIVVLNSDRQVFTFDKTSGLPNPTSQTATINLSSQNVVGTSTWSAIDENGAIVSSMLVGTGDTRTITVASFNKQQVTVTAVKGGLSDSVTIIKVVDGESTLNALLTNESFSYPVDADGVGSIPASAGGEMRVYEGATKVTAAYSIDTASTGLTISIDTAGVYTITALTADTAYADIKAVYKGATLIKRYNISKTLQGADGVSASLSNPSYVVNTDKDGNGGVYTDAGGRFDLFVGDVRAVGAVYSIVPNSYNGTGMAMNINSSTGVYTVTGLTTDRGVAMLRAVYQGKTYDRAYAIAKAKTGASGSNGSNGTNGTDGTNAPLLRLVSTAQAFTYNNVGGPIPASQTIQIQVVQVNLAGNPVWTVVNQAGAAVTYTLVNATTITINQTQFGSNTSVKVTAANSGQSDIISIVRLKDGATGANGTNALVGYLTNESHTTPAAADGSAPIMTGASGNFKVFFGLTDVTSGCTFSVVTSVGCTGTVSTTGLYSISAYTSSATLLGTLTVRATYSGSSIDKVFTISKSKAGSNGTNGTNGTNGANAPLVRLTSTAQSFTYNNVGSPSPASQSIQIQAVQVNLAGNPVWTVVNQAGTAVTYTLVNATTITINQTQFGSNTSVKVTATNSGQSDIVSIVRLKDGATGANGAPALVGYLTNESHTTPSAADGSVPTMTGASGNFKVFLGTTDITSSCTFSVVTNVGCTGTISTAGAYSVSSYTSNATLTGTLTVRATYSGSTIDKVFTVSKSKAGTNGTNGTNGANAPLVRLTSTAQSFTYNNVNNPSPASQTIQIQAIQVNLTGNPVWTVVNQAGAAVGYTTVNTTTITINQTQFGSNTWIKVTATNSGQSDIVSIVRLKDGATGANGTPALVGYLTNEAHTTPSAAGGASPTMTGASGNFKVFLGTTNITSSCTYSVVTSVGCTGTINTAGLYSVSAYSSNATIVGTITLRATYSGSTIDKIFTVSKSVAGNNGSNGSNGTNGTNGTNGDNGSGFYTYNSSSAPAWDAATAKARFLSVTGRQPKANDVFTQVNTALSEGPTKSATRIYTGSLWPDNSAAFSGAVVVNGSLAVSKLIADTAFVNNIGTSYIVDKPSFTGSLTPPATYKMLIDLQNGFIHIK